MSSITFPVEAPPSRLAVSIWHTFHRLNQEVTGLLSVTGLFQGLTCMYPFYPGNEGLSCLISSLKKAKGQWWWSPCFCTVMTSVVTEQTASMHCWGASTSSRNRNVWRLQQDVLVLTPVLAFMGGSFWDTGASAWKPKQILPTMYGMHLLLLSSTYYNTYTLYHRVTRDTILVKLPSFVPIAACTNTFNRWQ